MMTSADEERFYDKIDAGPGGGCHLWTAAADDKGYGQFRLDRKLHRAHRLAWAQRNGPIPDGLCVLHRCDRPGCVNPDHLFVGTHADNTQDMLQKGRSPDRRGEKHPGAKLGKHQVLAIRADPRFQQVIADDYGISQQQVHNIKARKLWSHV